MTITDTLRSRDSSSSTRKIRCQRPELKQAVGDVHADRHRQEKGFAVRMAVGGLIRRDVDAAAEIVVLVLAPERGASRSSIRFKSWCSNGSFSLTMIAVVVCFVCTLTQPCRFPRGRRSLPLRP